MSDRFSKICLFALLAVIALRPFAESIGVHAAAKSQYVVVEADPDDVKRYTEKLARYADDGWEFVAAPVYQRNGRAYGIMILKK